MDFYSSLVVLLCTAGTFSFGLKCEEYRHSLQTQCSKSENCTRTIECTGDNSACFVAWTNDRPSGHVQVEMQGCWQRDADTECPHESVCRGGVTERTAPLHFCCCTRDGCNARFSAIEFRHTYTDVTSETDNASKGYLPRLPSGRRQGPPDTAAFFLFYWSLLCVAGIIIFIAIALSAIPVCKDLFRNSANNQKRYVQDLRDTLEREYYLLLKKMQEEQMVNKGIDEKPGSHMK